MSIKEEHSMLFIVASNNFITPMLQHFMLCET